MRTKEEIEDKICELSPKIRQCSKDGDIVAMNCLLQQQKALKWVLS